MTAWTLTSLVASQEKPGTADNAIADVTTAALATGDHVLVGVAFDNLTATTPTLTGFTITGGTLTLVGDAEMNSNQAAAAAGVRGYLGLYQVTAGSASSGAAITATLSGNVAAKAMLAYKITGPASIEIAQAFAASTSTGSSFPTIDSVTPVNTTDGNLLVAFGAHETTSAPGVGTADASITAATSGGGAAANLAAALAYKVHDVDDAADDRFTVSTSTDGGRLYGVLREAAAGTTLTVADATQAQTSANAALTQIHALAADAATQAQAADNVAVTQVHVLAVQAATQAQAAENVVLSVTSSTTLVVADAAHAQTADSPTLVQTHVLTVQAANQAQTAGTPALVQQHTLVVADAIQAQTAESPTLTVGAAALVVAAATQAQTAGTPTLVQQHVLVIAAATQGQTAQTVTLSAPAGGTVTLTGDIDAILLAKADAPSVSHIRAYLVPATQPRAVATTVRLGGLKLTLNTAYAFSVANLPSGGYQLRVAYWDLENRRQASWYSPLVSVTASGDIASLL